MANFVYSSSPQIKSARTTKRIMLDVCIAMLPACIAGCILLGWGRPQLGWGALLQLVIASVSAVLAEFVFRLCSKTNLKNSIGLRVFLSIITLGIYGIYWMYLLVQNTRLIQKKTLKCTKEMLCLIFVPFYSWYWWYTRGEKVKQGFKEQGREASGSGVAYLILAIFGLNIISMIIMQIDFNSLESENKSGKKDTDVFNQILKEFDYTSLVTGMLVGMNMYANSKWYVPLLASVFAVVVVKMLFGGTGKNIVNPAIAGRIFAFISFGAAFGGTMEFTDKVLGPTYDYIQGATPLQTLFGKEAAGNTLTNLDLLLGTGVPGCIGEVCKVALIIGGIYLVVRGVLNFRWPLVYIATTGVVAVLINVIKGESFAQAIGIFLPSILSGGLILGAIFMATDYVTTPNTKLGNYVYFVLLGVVTAVLRSAVKGEVVSFAILFMNLFVPLIDKYIVRKPFGYVKPQKAKKEAAK